MTEIMGLANKKKQLLFMLHKFKKVKNKCDYDNDRNKKL